MNKIALQFEPQQQTLIDALKRGETVEIIHRGQVLGVASPKQPASVGDEERKKAIVDFFGMNKSTSADTVEEEVRSIRRGRNKRYDAL